MDAKQHGQLAAGHPARRPERRARCSRTAAARQSAGVALALLAIVFARPATEAADPAEYLPRGSFHRPFSAAMPPGTLGDARALGRGPVAGYFQPVRFAGPDGARFALAQSGTFQDPEETLMAGLLVGNVYRFRVTDIPGSEGAELYPTVELIDRTYPPPKLATLYPIPITLDEDDLQAALDGRFVTRVVYLEDPQTALAVAEEPDSSRAIDIPENQDALALADRLGRPVAIVRVGSLAPPSTPALMPQFFFGHPTWAPIYQPEETAQP